MSGEDFWEGVERIAGMRATIPEERRSVKTIRVVLVGSAVAVGRRCAIFSSRHGWWMWEPRRERAVEVAIVDVPINTLEPTDDGDPDELQLCEQAQREDGP